MPPIKLYQAKDVFQEELSSNQVIWDTLVKDMPAPTRMLTAYVPSKEGLSMKTVLKNSLNMFPALQRFYLAYVLAECNYEDALKKLGLDDELKAGELKFDMFASAKNVSACLF